MLMLHRGIAHRIKNYKFKKALVLGASIVMLAMFGVAFKRLTFADDNAAVGLLDVTYSSGSTYVDEDVADKTFDLSVQSGIFATIKIDAEFNGGEEKKITAKIPTGFKVLSYSATASTPEMSDVRNIEIDNAYKDFVESSNLTAATADTHVLDANGDQVKFASGSDWEDQIITGYAVKIKGNPDSTTTGYNEKDQRVYGGDIEWTFINTATKVELVFTVAIDNVVLNHTAAEEEMEDIVIDMSSTKGGITKDCSVRAKNVQIFSMGGNKPRYPGAEMYNFPGVSDVPGRSERFGIGTSMTLNNNTSLSISHYSGILIDELVATFNYPEGVYYDNELDITLMGTTITESEFEDEHITVSVDEDSTNGGGTIVVTLKDFRGGHATLSTSYPRIVAYFRADNTVYDASNRTILPEPTVEWSYRRNGATRSSSSPTKYNRRLVYGGENRDIEIAARNLKLRNLEEDYEDIHFNYLLGGFTFKSSLNYSDVTLRFTFENLGVRDIILPGGNIRNMSAKVKSQTTGEIREITVDDLSSSLVASLSSGVAIEGDQIGLEEDEYIVEYNATVDLMQGNYSANNYIHSACSYLGHFVPYDDEHMPSATLSVIDPNTGEVELDSSDEPMTATDHTTFGWATSRSGDLTATVRNAQNQEESTFYPNETISITGSIKGTNYIITNVNNYTNDNTNEVVDPTVIISLPEGIELDTASVQARSADGNRDGERFSLVQKSVPTTQIIDGVKWKTYYYKSEDPLALVARRQNDPYNTTKGSSPIYVYLQAVVGNNTPHYNLSVKDILSYDLGQPAARGSSKNSVYTDDANRSSKNTDETKYKLAATGSTIQIKPLIGFNVDIGIRTKGFDQDFMTYNGTDSSVAVVSKNNAAEVKVLYESTSSSVFRAGSVIYMPVPKMGVDYDKFFENIELVNPMVDTNNVTFSYSTRLASIPTLVGSDGTTWTTYFSTDVTGSNSQEYEAGDGAWEPVESQGSEPTWVEAANYTGSLDDVIMIKFVADGQIMPGATGECVYDLELDPTTDMEGDGIDYWRTYNKAITEDDNTGIWSYSSVIAVNGHGVGLEGQIFIDSNVDAEYSESDLAYGNGYITALLSRDDNTETTRSLLIDEDGHFINKATAASEGDATDFVLKEGDYTLTIVKDESETAYGFSKYESSTGSNHDTFYNDIKIDDISSDEQTAVYHFTVDPDSFVGNDYTVYIGIALARQNLNVAYEWDGVVPETAVLPNDETVYTAGDLVPIDQTYKKDGSIDGELDGKTGVFVFSGWVTDENIDAEGRILDHTVIRGSWTFEEVIPEPEPEDEPESETVPVPDTGQNTAAIGSVTVGVAVMIPVVITLVGLQIRRRKVQDQITL